MKLNTNISIENIVTIATIVCAITLAFGFMQYDIDIMKKDLDLKADKREMDADRLSVKEKQELAKECMDVVSAVLKLFVWKF